MKKIYFRLIAISLFIFNVNFSFGQSGIHESYVILNKNSTGNTYYDLQATTDNPDFSVNLGTFGAQSDTFILNGGQNNVNKCNATDNITSSWLDYRIYPTGSPFGTFTSIDLSTLVTDYPEAACGGAGNNQEWLTNNANINLLNGLTSGDYSLEVYSFADFTFLGTPQVPHFANNLGTNYIATFRVDDAPDALCQDITISLDASGNATITANAIDAGSADDFDTPILSIDVTSFDCSNLGANTVTLTVEDSLGQMATCPATVTVVDAINPTISCPADITVSNDADGCDAVVTYTVTFDDNCAGSSISQTTGFASGSTFPVGTTTNTFLVTDEAGNTETCSFDVTVTDNESPIITCAANIIVSANASCEATGVALGTPTTDDNCGVNSVTNNAPATFPLGITTVTWTVTDNTGLTATCTQTVTVNDTTPPTITCPANVTVNANASCQATGVTLGTPATADNCGVASVTNNAPATFPLGITTVTWTVTDNAGITTNCEQIVTVKDTTPPTITCPSNITLNANGSCGATGVALGTPITADNCGVASVTNNTPATFPLGSTTVTWTVTDNAGLTATCTQTVTVNDTTNPTITCPANIVVSANSSCVATGVALGTPTTADNCGVASVTNNAPVTFPLGITTVTWTVTDNAGITTTCEQIVTVNDTTPPTITCPANIIVSANGSCGATGVVLGTPTTADNCGIASVTNNAPSTFPLGITTVTWTVTDNAGLTTTCTQTVTLNDTTPPTITCPTNITVNANAACQATGVTLGTPTTADNCGVASVTNNAPAIFPLGITTVTWTVTDNAGLTATCTQTVTVNDTTPPTITCPANITVNVNAACQATGVALGTPTTADNCGVASVTNNAPATFPLGITTVTWIATDGSGNTAICNQTVTLNDTTNPTITCPANVTVSANASCLATGVALGTPTTDDNCGVASVTNNAPAAFPLGITTVTWTVTDNAGLTATCTQTVTVSDTTPPNVICQNISVTLDATGAVSIDPSQIDNGSTDNCGITSRSLDITSFDCDDLGTNTVTLSVFDAAGNVSTCMATVTVLDPSANSSVSISSNDANNQICLGDNLTFTATPSGDIGTTQFYEWFINGVSEGTTTVPAFTPITAPTADYTIFVRMTTDLSACDPKQSGTLTIVVSPLPTVNVSSTSICIDNTSQTATPTTGGTWTSSNTGVATISINGAITPVSPGSVSFTYTNSTTGCINTTVTVTINPLPVVTAPTSLCVNATAPLSPSSGGTWVSNNPARASVTSSGVITGISPGNATFTFTSASGCSATTSTVQILEIPVITSVTASPTTVCAGDNSILTTTVAGAGTNNAVIINYNFNSGTSYGNLNDMNMAGISSSLTSNIGFSRPNGGVVTTGAAFTQNTTPGGALRQTDNYQDGENGLGGTSDNGNWNFYISGSNLVNYQDFNVYFQAKRDASFGKNKRVRVDILSPNHNGGNWDNGYAVLNLPAGNSNWVDINFPLPPGVNNQTELNIRLQVNDGSDYDYGNYNCYTEQVCFLWFCWNQQVCDDYGAYNIVEPHILIDNFQVQAGIMGDDFDYDWTVLSGDNTSLPSTTNNPQITVTPNVSTVYQVSVTNSDGCPETETVTVNVFPSPEIIINADYCPPAPNNNQVQLVASANVPIVNWEWNTGETGNTIYVDTAGAYQVIGTTANGCTALFTLNVAQELVVDGDFTNFNASAPSFTTEYTQNQGYYNGNAGSGLYPEGRYAVNTSAYGTSSGNPLGYHPSFHGRDHTNNSSGARNFLMVNGSTSQIDPPGPEGPRQRIIWQQTVTVEPNTDYYFSAYAMNLNPGSPARLQFEVNGQLVGTVADLSTAPTPTEENQVNLDNWVRFYSNPTWNSGAATTAIIRIRNLNTNPGGNDFGLDDISFGTLSTFIKLTSPVGTDGQTICQNTSITEITYDIGGGLTAPNIEWYLNGSPTSLGLNVFPDGLSYTFNGLSYAMNGTPTEAGNYTYEITTTSVCDVKSATGSLTLEPEPVVTITTTPATVCASALTIPLSASLSGSATGGTWSIAGTPIATTVSGNVATATYTINTTGPVTFTFTSNDPAGSCEEAVETIEFNITPYIVATVGSNLTTANCAATTVTLTGNNVVGQWTAVPDTGYFSNASAYNSTFTGESGQSYTLTWTAANTSPCVSTAATMTVAIPDCGTNLVFDGADDHISFADNYPMTSGAFSIEAWIKAANVTGTKTIMSKRNASVLTTGYDFSLVESNLRFRYNNNIEITANQNINNSKWYHVAVTFDGANYSLYIDGFPVRTMAGSLPTANANKALIGAMDRTNNSPVNYFNGAIDEVRIWNTALSQAQIREMMNQEIMANGTNIMGEVIPVNITGALQWYNLIGYYQMNTGPQTLLIGGIVPDISTDTVSVPGKLNAMTNNQTENAPIPYVSSTNNVWDNQATWANGSVQQIPNSTTNNVVPGQSQSWNIVRTGHAINSNRNTTVLGLLVDTNRLSIISDRPLYVNKYLNIGTNGILDLVGESQLLQPDGSIIGNGAGHLERDQQGTSNLYSYNYWGSPVSSETGGYTVGAILKNGTDPNNLQDITWINSYDAEYGTTSMSNRWLYAFAEGEQNEYSDWIFQGATGSFTTGLGFTMKGSDGPDSLQNYTFVGRPNNGTIEENTVTASPTRNQTLVGNPYPSAIDAREFIRDNIPMTYNGDPITTYNPGTTQSIDGSLYFWKQATWNDSHVLAEYQGGYATLNLAGGLAAVSAPDEIGSIGDANTFVPQYYIPVGQGFFVSSAAEGDQVNNTIRFKNSQRFFVKESPSASVFFRNSNPENITTQDGEDEFIDNIQRVRLAFTTPEGAVRPLLLAFTPDNAASDAFDYGYDALNSDTFPNDMAFRIDDKNYVIQGVGEFDTTKQYPLGIFMSTGGMVKIDLTDLENFDDDIDVFVYDSLLGTYSQINDTNFQMQLEAGDYVGRFSIVFETDETLSTIDTDFKDIIVNYLQRTDEIYIKVPSNIHVKQVYLIIMAGQVVKGWNSTNVTISNEMKIPVKDLSEGHYIIKIHTDTNTFNKKIIVKY